MEIEQRNPTELIAFSDNPKLHTTEQIDHIAQGILMFGFTQPVVIDENNVILVGHGRTEAAKRVGLKEIPVVVKKGLQHHEKQTLCLVDNQLGQATGFDILKLDSIFSMLKTEGFPMVDLGFLYESPSAASMQGLQESIHVENHQEAGSTIRQIVIIFDGEDFDEAVKKFDKLMTKEKLKDHTEVFDFLLGHYESTRY